MSALSYKQKQTILEYINYMNMAISSLVAIDEESNAFKLLNHIDEFVDALDIINAFDNADAVAMLKKPNSDLRRILPTPEYRTSTKAKLLTKFGVIDGPVKDVVKSCVVGLLYRYERNFNDFKMEPVATTIRPLMSHFVNEYKNVTDAQPSIMEIEKTMKARKTGVN